MTVPPSQFVKEKEQSLEMSERALEQEGLPRAIEILGHGRQMIDHESPEDVDVEILDHLRRLHHRAGQHDIAKECEQERDQIASLVQSRDYLALARRYIEKNWDAKGPLEMAISVLIPNQYSREAETLRQEIEQQAVQD
jgi:hypothetical protein